MPAEAREVQALADGWSFAFGIADELPARPGFDDSDWAKVAVPHTWNRLGNHGTTRDATINADRGMGWSRRTLCAPAAGKRSFLEFDPASRSEERRVGEEVVSSGRLRGEPYK